MFRSLLFEMDFRWSDWKGSNKPQGGDDMVDVHIVPGMKYITDFKWSSTNIILLARVIFVMYLVTVNVLHCTVLALYNYVSIFGPYINYILFLF